MASCSSTWTAPLHGCLYVGQIEIRPVIPALVTTSMQLRILSRGNKHPLCQPVSKAKLLIGRCQSVTTTLTDTALVDAWVGSESIKRWMTWHRGVAL